LIGLARERIAERDDPVRRGIAIGAVAGVVGLLVHAWIDFNLHLPANALAFAALIGLATAPRRGDMAALESRAHEARGWRLLLAAVLVLAALASAWRAAGAWSLDRARREASPRSRITVLGELLPTHPYLTEAYRERARARMTLVAAGSGTVRFALIEHDLARALALRPLWAEAWADRAWVLWAKGDRGQARLALDRALALDPTHPGIRGFAVRLESDADTRPDPAPITNLK